MTIQGVEVEAVVIPIAGLSFSFNGAYTDTNIDKVQVPPIGGLTLTRSQITRYAPRFSRTVDANWVIPGRPFDSDVVLNSDGFHTSKFRAQYGQHLPDYAVGNARIGMKDMAGTQR